jgi:hypothetical protein
MGRRDERQRQKAVETGMSRRAGAIEIPDDSGVHRQYVTGVNARATDGTGVAIQNRALLPRSLATVAGLAIAGHSDRPGGSDETLTAARARSAGARSSSVALALIMAVDTWDGAMRSRTTACRSFG